MITKDRILAYVSAASFIFLTWFLVIYVWFIANRFTFDALYIAAFAAGITFSVVRPKYSGSKAAWMVSDGLVAFFMVLAFSQYSEFLGVFLAASMRAFNYLSFNHGTALLALAMLVSPVALFLVFGFNVPFFAMAPLWAAVFFGSIVSIQV